MHVSTLLNVSGSGVGTNRIEDLNPRGLRVAQYPDGSKRVQGSYQWSEGSSWGVAWRDLPLVSVGDNGQEIKP